jgi:hypothetical protein
MPEIFDSAEAAWNFLVQHGGLEPTGRDAPLIEQLTERLARGARFETEEESPQFVLEDVLKRVNVEHLVNVLFGVLHPFVGMMRDLLDYFAGAGVTEGPNQWKLALTSETETLEVDLDHFKKYIAVAQTRAVPLDVPSLTRNQRWEISSAAFSATPDDRRPIGMRPVVEKTDSGAWFSSVKTTNAWESQSEPLPWLPLPRVVYRMLQRDDSLKDAAAVLLEFTSVLQSYVPNYQTLDRERDALRRNATAQLREYLETEHDRWIETMVANLAAFEVAPELEQSRIVQKLADLFKGVDRRAADFVVSLDDLRAFLDLPIWQRRYELYSAWILTQYLIALEGHNIDLHSEDGKLTFGFHATKLATVRSLREPVTIYGERRIVSTDLKGHGRKAGIQPDYTVWAEGIEQCQMAIECKHYKRPSYSNFRNALEDYAANLPAARVLLGNYGPIPLVLKLDTTGGGSSGRQFAFGNLNPDHQDEIHRFRKAIRDVFGEPLTSKEQAGAQQTLRVLAFDVSPSMHDVLKNEGLRIEVEKIVRDLAITHFAAADNRLLVVEIADMNRLHWLVTQSRASTTALGSAAEQLRQSASEVYFITDDDGARSLGYSANRMWAYADKLAHLRKLGAVLLSVKPKDATR